MTKTDSDSPVEVVPGGFKFKVRWKFVASCVGLFLGGSTVAGLATTVGVGTSVAQDFDSFKMVQGYAHDHIDKTLKTQDDHATEQDGKIKVISDVIGSVQTTQQRDVARTEARRLTEKIRDRDEREEAYDRLYELNLKRLQRNVDPCGTVNCN